MRACVDAVDAGIKRLQDAMHPAVDGIKAAVKAHDWATAQELKGAKVETEEKIRVKVVGLANGW